MATRVVKFDLSFNDYKLNFFLMTFKTNSKIMDLSIKPIKTSKDKIKQPPLAKADIIPKLGSSIIMCGRSGCGKTTLLHNLLVDDRFYGKNEYFKNIFLFSPSAEIDDLQKELDIPDQCIFTDLTTAPAALEQIYKHQTTLIKKLGNDKAPQIAIIMDDCIGDTKFMKNAWTIKAFIASRHFNCTTLICAQHFNRIERVNRLQASSLFFWPMSASAMEVLADEFTPSSMTKKQFVAMVEDALKEPYAFLHINMKVPDDKRYRINLDKIINLDYYKSPK
jgi:hypothetical protein